MKSILRKLRRGQKAFTLIELLIVVAILGVLAAVIIPNVGRFLGRGEDEARQAEKTTVQNAVYQMMIDQGLGSAIPNPVTGGVGDEPTNDMSAFPDYISDDDDVGGDGGKYYDQQVPPVAFDVAGGDGAGWVLYDLDATGGGAAGPLISYVDRDETVYYYTCDADGEIHQYEFGGAGNDVPDAGNPEL